jgi:hypothetical protein
MPGHFEIVIRDGSVLFANHNLKRMTVKVPVIETQKYD